MKNEKRRRFASQQIFAVTAAVAALLSFSSCAHVPARHDTAGDAASLAGTGAADEVAQDDYILGIDDIVKITTENHPEWSGDFTVGPNGKITIPSLGEISAYGMTKDELAKTLSADMQKYINNPVVVVRISKYASEAVYVLGEVNKPGRYSTDGKKLRIRDVIVNAGLTTKNAAICRTFVISASRNRPKKQVVNLDRVLNHGDLKRNIEIKPGDVVYVPETIIGIIGDFIGSLINPINSAVSVRVASGGQY
jgi:polysaccharide export outer membrane protein